MLAGPNFNFIALAIYESMYLCMYVFVCMMAEQSNPHVF